MKPCDETVEGSYDSSSPTSLSKQRRITATSDSLLTHSQALDTSSAAWLSVTEAAVLDHCKQEGIEPEVVSSDMDFVGFDDDPTAFLDIWKTINGSEVTSEFQKCLSESERDDSNVNLSAGELTCLSVSDVAEAVTDKLTAPQHVTGEHLPSLQTAALLSLQPVLGETKCREVSPSSQILPADNYSMPLWHQNMQMPEPMMPHLQLLPTSLPSYWPDSCPELLKHHQVIQMKAPRRRQLQSHDAHSLSRMDHLQQQQPQRSHVQSWFPPTQRMQQYEITADQQSWPQQEWHTSAHCMQQAHQQLLPYQTVGMYGRAVKKEMPLSGIVSSAHDAITRPPQHMMSSLSENAGRTLLPHAHATAYTNVEVAAAVNQNTSTSCEPAALDCNQLQRPAHGFLVNVSFSPVVIPEFCSPSNFVAHGATGQVFGHAEANQLRGIAQVSDSACPAVSRSAFVPASDHFISH